MGKSGNPAIAAVARASAPQDFKKKRAGTFELPSGLFMKLRNPGGLKIFLSEGIIPNSLMSTVHNALDGKKMDAEEMLNEAGGVDESQIADMMALMDAMMVRCAIEPKVHPVPENEDDRDDELLYADELDDNDKMFVFQWVTGGTTDLERFREQHTKNMAALDRS
jgi:hypothetical protein